MKYLSKKNNNVEKPSIKDKNLKFYAYSFGFILTLCSFFSFTLLAQSTMNATGGSGNIGDNHYAYSIGEMVLVSTIESSKLTITQGLLQPALTITSVEQPDFLYEGLKIYPNPAHYNVFVQADLGVGGVLILQLHDLHGRLISHRSIRLHDGQEKQHLSFIHLPVGTYLLQAILKQDGREYQHSYRIIKM